VPLAPNAKREPESGVKKEKGLEEKEGGASIRENMNKITLIQRMVNVRRFPIESHEIGEKRRIKEVGANNPQ